MLIIQYAQSTIQIFIYNFAFSMHLYNFAFLLHFTSRSKFFLNFKFAFLKLQGEVKNAKIVFAFLSCELHER